MTISSSVSVAACVTVAAVQDYMLDTGDGRTSADPVHSAHDVFRIVNAQPELRDEMFCILAKQVTDNRSFSR